MVMKEQITDFKRITIQGMKDILTTISQLDLGSR